MSSPELIELLRHGDMTVKGRMPWSSNATFLTEVCSHHEITLAVYKPARGERPLWDFPHGLWKREVAAFELSDHLGWHLVPPEPAGRNAQPAKTLARLLTARA